MQDAFSRAPDGPVFRAIPTWTFWSRLRHQFPLTRLSVAILPDARQRRHSS
jgi:hypothetical protein